MHSYNLQETREGSIGSKGDLVPRLLWQLNSCLCKGAFSISRRLEGMLREHATNLVLGSRKYLEKVLLGVDPVQLQSTVLAVHTFNEVWMRCLVCRGYVVDPCHNIGDGSCQDHRDKALLLSVNILLCIQLRLFHFGIVFCS